jgi:hypothetical protein
MPRQLQDQIHSTYITGGGIWVNYRSQITGLWSQISGKNDFNDHLIREFNRKAILLGLNSFPQFPINPNINDRYIGDDNTSLI